jgi:type I restriction enzyme S subunit
MSTVILHREKNETLMPELRFQEFTGDWKNIKLGDYIKIKSGNSPSSYELIAEGIYPFIKVEELNNCDKYQNTSRFYSNDNKNLVEKFSVIFPKRGAAILNNKVRINDCPILMDSNMMAITPLKNKLNYEFLYYKIVKEELYKIADTSTIPQINNKHIEPYKLFIPLVNEQQKIASFLSAVDEKIQQLSRKKELLEQYKKGIMQQLFSGKLRFKDENGEDYPDWEEKKLGVVCKLNPKSSFLPSSFIYIDLESVVSGQLLKETRIQLSEAPSRAQRLLSREDILFQMVRPYQKNNLFFNRNGEYVASTGYAQLRAKENSMFLYQLIHTTDFVNKVMDRCTGTSYPAINSSDLANIEIVMPSVREQQKIANFLSSIDDKIESIKQQITQTQTFKKGLLQQMFV